MKCPNDGNTLLITERQGIEIDYCPECRGVWLDRGELDKFIEKADTAYSQPGRDHQDLPRQEHQERHHEPHNKYQESHSYHKKHRKESFLGDLFDF